MPQQHWQRPSLLLLHNMPWRVKVHPAACLQLHIVAGFGVDKHKHLVTNLHLRRLRLLHITLGATRCSPTLLCLALLLPLCWRLWWWWWALGDGAAAFNQVCLPGLADDLQLQCTCVCTNTNTTIQPQIVVERFFVLLK